MYYILIPLGTTFLPSEPFKLMKEYVTTPKIFKRIKKFTKETSEFIKLKLLFGTIPLKTPNIIDIDIIPEPIKEYIPTNIQCKIEKIHKMYTLYDSNKEVVRKMGVNLGGFLSSLMIKKFTYLENENKYPYFYGPPDPNLIKSILKEVERIKGNR